jgi:hypothetical protein
MAPLRCALTLGSACFLQSSPKRRCATTFFETTSAPARAASQSKAPLTTRRSTNVSDAGRLSGDTPLRSRRHECQLRPLECVDPLPKSHEPRLLGSQQRILAVEFAQPRSPIGRAPLATVFFMVFMLLVFSWIRLLARAVPRASVCGAWPIVTGLSPSKRLLVAL